MIPVGIGGVLLVEEILDTSTNGNRRKLILRSQVDYCPGFCRRLTVFLAVIVLSGITLDGKLCLQALVLINPFRLPTDGRNQW